ncbi:MAG TPA: hypothetical protein VF403_09310, partial [Kofleriaceae bacterium]
MNKLSIGITAAATLVGCSTNAPTASTQSAITSGAAIDFAEDWVNYWFAPDTGQRGVNIYGHESDGYTLAVDWAGDDPTHPSQYSATSDCSFFIDATMENAYAWTAATLKTWLCTSAMPCGTRPLAKHYYNAVLAESHFAIVPEVAQVQRGDLIAIKYDTGTDTGHVMWVDSSPRSAGTATDGGGATIYLYDVDVVDSSSTYHWTTDLRYTNGIGHGIGKGTIRL